MSYGWLRIKPRIFQLPFVVLPNAATLYNRLVWALSEVFCAFSDNYLLIKFVLPQLNEENQ